MLTDLDKKILLTLSYTDQFNFPLRSEELYTRLISRDNIISLNQVTKALNQLVVKSLVSKKDSMYFLSNSRKNNRVERKLYSEKKWLEAIEFVRVTKRIPWIKGILITGSLAVNNAKKDDDIDFMIVTTNNRLWLTRLLLILFASINGKRRSWSNEEKNSWCFNLFVDESELRLDRKLRSIYGAYEVSQAVWLYSRAGTKERFFDLNKWVKQILPRYYSNQRDNLVPLIDEHDYYFPIISEVFSILNLVSYLAQYAYMKPHMTREKVGKSFAFFHPRDTKRKIFENWKETLKKINYN